MHEGRVTGFVRVVDDFGRISIPTEVRRVLNLGPNVMTEYFYDDEKKAIIVNRYAAEECLFCSGKQETICFKKFHICKPCIQSLPALQVFLERVERNRANEIEMKKMTKRRKEALLRLHRAIKENPKASQKELARITGFSQAWVSKLIRGL